MLAVFLEPAPGVIQHHGAAVEEEREDGRAGEAGLAAEQTFEESDDAGHIRHEEGEPEGCYEVEG